MNLFFGHFPLYEFFFVSPPPPYHFSNGPSLKPRDSPRFVLQFDRAAAITSCVKTYETYEMELWWLLLLADIFRRQNVEVTKCDPFCPGNFIVWSLDMSREFP